MTDLTEVRRKAWETRRARYGAKGHNSSYARWALSCGRCKRMMDTIVRLHREGVLSEGQAARAIGLGRVALRVLADEQENASASPGAAAGCRE